MSNLRTSSNRIFDDSFFENVTPTKLTEARRIKLCNESWGLLTEYYLESAKLTRLKSGEVYSAATIRVGDRSGQITCVVTGPTIGLLFGLPKQAWIKVEKLCGPRQQLFYRYFKDGLSNDFSFEQRLFYNFCLTNQKTDVLVAVFRRCVNKRKKDSNNAFLDILELRKCDISVLDHYIDNIRKSVL